ncbi:MAG: hypothetical protein J6K55_02195 [Clostridia bacterium]|nr:hypothetical protein [Clostridia bacterium]
MGKTIAVCSGSGGAGKTMIAVSVAVGAAKRGKKSILLDASGVSRAADLILGVESLVSLDLADVAAGQTSVDSSIYPVCRYQHLYYACASLYDSTNLADLHSILLILQSMCDLLVIDMPSGVIHPGKDILCKEDCCAVVLRPDHTSLRSCERLLAGLPSAAPEVSLILNRVSREQQRQQVQYDESTVQMILDRTVAGSVPEDKSIAVSAAKGRPAIECDGPAWTALNKLTDALLIGV